MNVIPSEILADMEAVTNGNRDAELLRRVLQRSKETQEELLEKYGVREIAVELVRQSRDEG